MANRARWITCLSAGLIVLGAVPAQAADYRYWTYWTPDGNIWQYSQVGPASVAVSDGDVQGWRFGVSTDDGAAASAPRFDLAGAFDVICGGSAAPDGHVRVALIIDPGLPDIAPAGEIPGDLTAQCAVVPGGSTGASALSAGATLRVENGFVCAINGYPARECAAAVEPVRAEPTIPDPLTPLKTTDDGDPLPLMIGGGAVVLGLAAAWFLRRRST